MRIAQVSIRKYRVFDRQVDIPLKSLTVLTGPNNLGKSTVLRALELFFSVVQRPFWLRSGYDYEADYPKRYEGRAGRRWPTQIRVHFELSNEDRALIAGDAAVEIPDTIEISLEFRFDDLLGRVLPNFEVSLDDEAAKDSLLSWLRDNVRYVYIPATRNVEDFRRSVFTELISGAIDRVSRSRQRILSIKRLYDDVLQEVSQVEQELATELQRYLPNVNELKFAVGELSLDRLISVRDVEIDDGARTALEQKGDGFKSLFSISVLQYIAKQRYGKNLIFGIEEPEAHLHSSAIYEIKSTLRLLSESFQVVITTHSPILIQRDDLNANIIVEHAGGEDFASTTSAARNLAQIRRSLGIRPQENMTTAEVVVVVEGATEVTALPKLLGRVRPELDEPLAAERVSVLSANAAANIGAVVRALARDAASCIVLVDADEDGLNAANRVRNSGLLRAIDVFQVPAREGCNETEFEDAFDPALYLDRVCLAAGLELNADEFERFRRLSGGRRTRFAKWSDVMAAAANHQGRDWGAVADDAKAAIATALAEGVEQIPVGDLQWVRAIADRVVSYLREEQGVA